MVPQRPPNDECARFCCAPHCVICGWFVGGVFVFAMSDELIAHSECGSELYMRDGLRVVVFKQHHCVGYVKVYTVVWDKVRNRVAQSRDT